MSRTLSLVITCLALVLVSPAVTTASSVPAARQQATLAKNGTTIQGEIVATGRYIYNWLDDDLCALAFWDYDFTPDLIVTNEKDEVLASLPLAELPGSVTMAGTGDKKHAEVCTVPFEISVPSSASYRIVLDPYFESDLLTSTELKAANWTVDIAFERQDGDPAPDFRNRPGGKIPGTDLYRIAGTFELLTKPGTLSFFSLPIGGCAGLGGYDDIVAGKQITVSDQTGSIVAVGELEPIYLIEENIGVPGDQRCVFTFTIDVPVARFYTFELARRGEVTYSKQEMDEADWHLDLSIGP